MTYISIDVDSYDYTSNYKIKNHLLREFFAEFFGTFIMNLLTTGSAASYALRCHNTDGHIVCDVFGASFGAAMGVLLGVLVSISISVFRNCFDYFLSSISAFERTVSIARRTDRRENLIIRVMFIAVLIFVYKFFYLIKDDKKRSKGGHLNPIVTLALAIVNKFSYKKILVYVWAQYLGAFCATALVYANYRNAINAFDDGIRSGFGDKSSTGQIFTTFPADSASIFGVFLDQMICASIVMFAVLAVMDEKNVQIPKYLIPVIISLIICGIIVSFGLNCGAALNPARDLSGRLFLALIGYGSHVFQPLNGLYWLIGGIIGPHMGAIVGSAIYLILIEIHHKNAEQLALIQ